MPLVVLYSQPGSPLCAEALSVLQRVQNSQPFHLEEVDVRADPALLAEYGEQLPVVTLNGTFLCEYVVDEKRLRELLRELS